jgi:hypothetical protein
VDIPVTAGIICEGKPFEADLPCKILGFGREPLPNPAVSEPGSVGDFQVARRAVKVGPSQGNQKTGKIGGQFVKQ